MQQRRKLVATCVVVVLLAANANARHVDDSDDKNAIVGHVDYKEPVHFGPQSAQEMAYDLDEDEVAISEIGKDVDHLRSADSYLMSAFARRGPTGPRGPPGPQGDPGPAGPDAAATKSQFSTLSPMRWDSHQRAANTRQAQLLRHKLESEGELKKKLASVYELRRRLRATVHKIRTATGQTAKPVVSAPR